MSAENISEVNAVFLICARNAKKYSEKYVLTKRKSTFLLCWEKKILLRKVHLLQEEQESHQSHVY